MKKSLFIAIFIHIVGFVYAQNSDNLTLQNAYGYQIVEVNGKYIIQDRLAHIAIPDTFDKISLEPKHSYELPRNSFVCQKGKEYYLISPTCEKKLKFDTLQILYNSQYICELDGTFSLMDDYFHVLVDSLQFLSPMRINSYEFIFKKDDFFGLLDEENILVELQVDSIIDLGLNQFLTIVDNDQMGIFDRNLKKVVIKPQHDNIYSLGPNCKKSMCRFIVCNDNQLDIMDEKGKILTPYSFEGITEWIEYGPKDGYFISKNGKLGVINRNGKERIPPIYDDLIHYSLGVYMAIKNHKFGMLDEDCHIIIPFEYDNIVIENFGFLAEEKSFVYALKDKVWIKLDLQGQLINTNCNECPFIKELSPDQKNRSRFNEVRRLMTWNTEMKKHLNKN